MARAEAWKHCWHARLEKTATSPLSVGMYIFLGSQRHSGSKHGIARSICASERVSGRVFNNNT